MYNVEDVFTPGTQPSITYNSRQKEELEKKLSRLLQVKGKIGIISGKSKVGKTVLVRKIIDDSKSVIIQPEELEEHELAEILAMKVKVPQTISKETVTSSSSNSATAKGSFEGEGKFTTFFASFKARLLAEAEKKSTKVTESQIESLMKSYLFDEVVEYMIKEKKVLVFEDFHYVDESLQKSIIHKLKEPLRQGLSILIVLIPRDKDLVTNLETDMKSRIKTIEVPPWSDTELSFIAETGFKKLNIDVDRDYIDSFVENSFRSPQLMQDICCNFCLENDIESDSSQNLKKIPFEKSKSDEELTSFYKDLETGEESTVKALRNGTRTSGRKEYELLSGEKKDVYNIIIDVIGEKADQDIIEWQELYQSIRSKLKQSNSVQQIQITNTLKYITKLSSDINPNEPPIVYVNKQIPLENAMLCFALRWSVYG